MKKTYLVGRKHYSYRRNKMEIQKLYPKTKNLVKPNQGECSICGRSNSQSFSEKMRSTECFRKKWECKHGHGSPISKSTWCALKFNATFFNLRDMRPRSKCKCQEQMIYTPNQFQPEKNGCRKNWKTIYRNCESMDKNVSNQRLMQQPLQLVRLLGLKQKHFEVGLATMVFLKCKSGVRIWILIDQHSGNDLRVRIMHFYFNDKASFKE